MARAKPGGRPLVIVESPAKARTIGRFLGQGYMIEASIGHVRDLPDSAAEIPPSHKGEKWARLGIDIERGFAPLYVVPREKREQIRKLKGLLKQASVVYLATDEDREGESISWHLVQVLEPRVEVKRLVFNEITREAIQHALQSPRAIDQALVEAQEARRLVDRLYGYSVSPLLWRKIRPKLSAGRVQSVAIRLVVDRERERIAFRSANYWDVEGEFATSRSPEDARFTAGLVAVGDRRVATGKDFGDDGKLKAGRETGAAAPLLPLDESGARRLVERLAGKPATVAGIESKPYVERPAAPFTTSTLQQEAGRKLRFAAQRTMRAAQRLYENGYITYMRTDSTTLSDEALSGARAVITQRFGSEHLPEQPRQYQTKVRNAQEAHEAIRPAGAQFVAPDALGDDMGEDERRIYELVWRRTIASQMPDSKGQRTTLTLKVDDAEFQATGKTITYPGFRLAYVEDVEEAESELEQTERILPDVRGGERLEVLRLEPKGHDTQPPPRLTEAGLIKELEARGIGRPSTYASIIETILARDYVFKRGTALVPTFTAFAVVNLLTQHLAYLVDYEFTAKMEEELDEISNGGKQRLAYLQEFYAGDGKPGLKHNLEKADRKIDPKQVCGVMRWQDGGEKIELRVGRYGPFLAAGDRKPVSLPDELPPDSLDLELVRKLLAESAAQERTLGVDPETSLQVFVKVGRFGPYFQLGTAEDAGKKNKPKMASLLRGMTPEGATLEQALAVLRLPREVGREVPPAGGEPQPILAMNGRYGPYLKWGDETRSIPAERTPLDVTLAEARALFAQPKAPRGRGPRRQAAALKELGARPGGALVKLMEGHYGPYVTDGTTNASLPRGERVEDLSLQRAIELLEARAARGVTGPRRRARMRGPR
jgi:DNA topoisomerase-1